MLPKIYIEDVNVYLLLVSVYKNEILNKFNLNLGLPRDNNISKDDFIIFDVHNTTNLIGIEKQYPYNKKIFLDIQGENTIIELKSINEWLLNKNNYLISQRYEDIHHDRATTGLKYLSLLYYFAKFKFYAKSEIPLLYNNNSQYDFITFLGKSKNKKSQRLEILKNFLESNITKCKYNHNDFDIIDIIESNNYYHDVYDFSWNILQSYQGKINIIFESTQLSKYETMSGKKVDNFLGNFFYFTEKTLRCLMTPNPSILIVDKNIISYLKSIGFDFPYDGFHDYDDVKKYIEHISSVGIDEWMDTVKEKFIHNSKHIWNFAYKKENSIIEKLKIN